MAHPLRVLPATLAAAAGFLLPLPAAGQTTAKGQPSAAKPAEGGVVLSGEPYRLDSVGLSVLLPVGASAQATRIGEQATVQISPAPPDSGWLLTIQTPQSKDLEMTVTEVADTVVAQLLGAYGVTDKDVTKVVETGAKVLHRDQGLTVNGHAAERFYVEVPAAGDQPALVRGYTVFRVAPGRFCAFDLITPKTEFPRSRAIYETTIATATFVDPADLASSRGAVVKAGVAALSGLTSADYEAVIAGQKERWYRYFRPAPTGSDADAQEIAYKRVRAWRGQQGELDPDRPKSRWTAADRQEGYLFRIDARYIAQGQIVDSVGIYFLSADRDSEAWSLKMAVRGVNGSTVETTTETGARSGTSMTISTGGTGRPGEVTRPVVPREGYISQLESFILPQLLIRAGATADYGFYAYQSAQGNVRIRRDSLSRPAGGSATWQMTSKSDEDRPPQVSFYNEAGDLIRTKLPDGSVWEPVELDRLVGLWKSKGMPMD